MVQLPDDLPTKTVHLPGGYTVTFSYNKGVLGVEWEPGMPAPDDFRTPRHRRKLVAAYQKWRDEYLKMLATVMGGSIAILDVDSNSVDATVIQPERRH